MRKIVYTSAVSAIALLAATAAQAQIKIACVSELSGPGATVGVNFKNGADLAIAEINAKGGILGQQVTMT